jgi:hypothetical protein
MTADLPTAADTNITARRGVTLLQARLERESWLFRRQDSGDADFGVDAEIEVVQSNKVTGRLFKGQIKSSNVIEWMDDEASVSVKVTTYNLWREMPLLTVLFLVDTTTKGIYWTSALTHHPAPGRASLSIKFDKGSDIRSDISPLTSYLASWFSVRSADTVLHEVPQFYQVFLDLRRDIDHYDDPMDMHEDEHGQLRLFYQHVLRLRLDLGLRNDAIPNLADWYARESGTWGNDDVLSWAIFSELMKFITPYYQESLERLCHRLERVDLTAENFRVKTLVDQLRGQLLPYQSISVRDPRAADRGFQRAFEKKLQRAGVVKHPYFDK